MFIIYASGTAYNINRYPPSVPASQPMCLLSKQLKIIKKYLFFIH